MNPEFHNKRRVARAKVLIGLHAKDSGAVFVGAAELPAYELTSFQLPAYQIFPASPSDSHHAIAVTPLSSRTGFTIQSPSRHSGGAHAPDVAPVAQTSDGAKPDDAKPSKSAKMSPVKLVEARNSAIRSRKVRAKSHRSASPAVNLSGTHVATEEGTAASTPATRSPPPIWAETSGDDKEAGSGGQPYVPVIATAPLRRPMLKTTASTGLPTSGGFKRGASFDTRALAAESPAASDDIESATTRRKSSVRFGPTTIREISHLTVSLIEHHRQMVALFVVCFLCVLVSAGCVLLFLMLRQGPSHYLDACSTLGCKRAIRDLERVIDVSIDPCHDFYGHVCRRWLKSYDAGYVDRAARDLLRDLNSSLNEVDEPNRVSTSLFSLAQFYQFCNRFIGARNLQLSDMLRPFEQYVDLLALSTFPDVIGRVVDLSLVHGVRTLLDIRLVRLQKAAVRLRIGCGISLAQKCCDNSSAELHHYLSTLLSAVSEMLPKDGPHHSLDASDITHVDTHVQPLMVAPINEQSYVISVFESLNRQISSNQWLEAINTVLPVTSRLGKHSRVILTHLGAITELLDYFASRKDKGVVYVYVQVLMEAMRFDYLRQRSTDGPEGVVRICLRATWSSLSGAKDVVASQFVRSHETMARAVFERVLSSVLQDAERSPWMGDLIKRNANVMLKGVSLRSFAAAVSNGVAIEAAGVSGLSASSALSVFPALFLNLRKARQKRFLDDPPLLRVITDEYGSDDFLFFESRVVYDVVSNSLRVPEAVRREPILYPEDVPLEFALGTLGMLIARELLRAAVPSRMPSLWTSQEQVAFMRYDQCVDSLRGEMNISLERPQDNQAPEYYYWLQGARTAYAALSASYAAERHAANWNTYWRAAQRTFFRRLCLLSCRPQHDTPEQRQILDPASVNLRSPAVPARVSCLLPLLNMPEFVEAFECSKTAPACAVA
ncbi:uncharacterized protein LOC142570437 [Dermacentor variabilis]|uniref:uncharacterized protein LOC142570437 n=1 Tax=Dermacentor variabilis TaxID=34621 RepID=UPI003F5B826C